MRICLVAPRYPPQTGGVERHVRELTEGFVARGHEVVVHTADRGEAGDARERRGGVRVRRHRGASPGGAFHVAPGVAPAVGNDDAELVHVHNYHALPALFGTLGAGDRPLVATAHYHGASADPVRDRLLSVYRPVGGWALRRADRVLAVGDWERERLATDFGVVASVVPNGVDVDRFGAAEPVDRDRPYLLTVGRLVEYKGVQHAIRALDDLPEYDLVVAGDGPHRDPLEAIAADAGVAERVTFAGYVPDADLPGLYAGAAAHLALSGFEAYGLTVGESLAAGTPCAVRPAMALADWTGRADCVTVTDLSPVGVASAVREAVGLSAPADPLPTWDQTVDGVLDVYREVR